MTSIPIRLEAKEGAPAYSSQTFYLGMGETLVAKVTGNDWDSPHTAGYPQPTITEAKTIAEEMIRRWNAHEGLLAALKEAEECLSHNGLDTGPLPGRSQRMRFAIAQAEGRV